MTSRRATIALSAAAATILLLGGASAFSCSGAPPSGARGGPAADPAPTPETAAPVPPGTGAVPNDRLEDPGPPAIRTIGRFDTRDPRGPVAAWPGARVLANFTGPSVTVKLRELEAPDGPSEWDVAIDGQWRPDAERLVTRLGTHDYELAKGLPAGRHSVELFKRTEAQAGRTQVLGFTFDGGSLLPPPLPNPRRVEVVGDSEVSGYGYAGASTGDECDGRAWEARFQNFHASWASLVAEHLRADVAGTVYSGKGFYYNAWRPDDLTMGRLFPRADPDDEASTFDFGRFRPAAVVVSLGGNDYNPGQPEDTGPPPFDAFTAKVRELVGMVRSAYPDAHIFLMAYAMLSDGDPPGRMKRTNVSRALTTVMDERHADGDAKVYFLSPREADYTELTACSGHGGPEYHARIAKFVEEAIADKTGWR